MSVFNTVGQRRLRARKAKFKAGSPQFAPVPCRSRSPAHHLRQTACKTGSDSKLMQFGRGNGDFRRDRCHVVPPFALDPSFRLGWPLIIRSTWMAS